MIGTWDSLYTVTIGNFLTLKIAFISENQEKLCVLTAELLEHCNDQKGQPPYRPRTGEACCAKYTSNVLFK